MNNIGQAIKKIRRMNNISQITLAQKIKTTQRTISRWEKGKTRIPANIIQQLAEFFNMPIQSFFSAPSPLPSSLPSPPVESVPTVSPAISSPPVETTTKG